MAAVLKPTSQRPNIPRHEAGEQDSHDSGAVHFVLFRSTADQRFANAVRVFGQPDFLHRLWDSRALREISEGDTVIFAEGDSDQAVALFNGDEAYYEIRHCFHPPQASVSGIWKRVRRM